MSRLGNQEEFNMVKRPLDRIWLAPVGHTPQKKKFWALLKWLIKIGLLIWKLLKLFDGDDTT